ncbi:MAG: acetyltransferase [Rhodoferax sp.]|nr:acetyltransferase [Rhodoferax sp.]MDP3651360.1 acetyltransferase [Rhodoferax sp.]
MTYVQRRRLLIVGAGGHGRSVAEAVFAAGIYDVLGFVDDTALGIVQVGGYPVLGTTDDLSAHRTSADIAIVAVGNNALRETLCDKLLAAGFELATVVHPLAFVSPSAAVGLGSAILAGAIVGAGARLGSGVILNCGAVVDHDAQVHDYGHLGVNACMSGGSVLGRRAWMQAGSALGYGAKVDDGVVLQAGMAMSAS